jgi:hypothetical protein
MDAPRRSLRVFQKNYLFFGHALLTKILNQLRVAPVRLRKRIEHVAMLPLQHADDVNPRAAGLPISCCWGGLR